MKRIQYSFCLLAAMLLAGGLLSPVSADERTRETLVSMSEALGLQLVPVYEDGLWCFDSVQVAGQATKKINVQDNAFHNLIRQLGPQVNFLCPEATSVTLVLLDGGLETLYRGTLRREEMRWQLRDQQIFNTDWISNGEAGQPARPPVEAPSVRFPPEPSAEALRDALTRLFYGDFSEASSAVFRERCAEVAPQASEEQALSFACWARGGEGAPTANRLVVIQQFQKVQCDQAADAAAYDCLLDLRLTALGTVNSVQSYNEPGQLTVRFIEREGHWWAVPH